MDVLLALSVHLTDETRLDRVLPYLVDMLRDDDAIVRLAALRTLVQLVRKMHSLSLRTNFVADTSGAHIDTLQLPHLPGIRSA
jgi:HEAT repeat protein